MKRMWIVLSLWVSLQAEPFPISFAVPECKVVKELPKKDKDFAFLIPWRMETYIYNDEASYYKDYQRSYFAFTCKKGGWDCVRHYEILANGCIPYFLHMDQCHPSTMAFLPRALIQEAMNLEGVSLFHIDHSKFDRAKYYAILEKLLTYTRSTLTTKAMARHVLDKVRHTGQGKILYLKGPHELTAGPGICWVDHLCDFLLIGFKELLGHENVVDYPKVDYIYQTYGQDLHQLYGKGMTYSKIFPDTPINRTNIAERIRAREFSLIVYGSVHRGMPFLDIVQAYYPEEQIVYVCGEDEHRCSHRHRTNLFLREW